MEKPESNGISGPPTQEKGLWEFSCSRSSLWIAVGRVLLKAMGEGRKDEPEVAAFRKTCQATGMVRKQNTCLGMVPVWDPSLSVTVSDFFRETKSKQMWEMRLLSTVASQYVNLKAGRNVRDMTVIRKEGENNGSTDL